MFKPILETLEDRWMPASLVTSGRGSITYIGDTAAHVLHVTDNGRGTVSAVLDGHAPVICLDTYSQYFQTSGPDQIDWTLTAPYDGYKTRYRTSSVMTSLGGSAHAALDARQGFVSGYWYAYGVQSGSATMDVSLGSMTGYSTLVGLYAYNYSPQATTRINVGGNIGAYFYLECENFGGTVAVNFIGTISYAAEFEVSNQAPGGSVAMNLNVLAGSTGTLEATVEGNTLGDDDLTLNIDNQSGGSLHIDAEIWTTIGNPNVHHTSNVEVLYY